MLSLKILPGLSLVIDMELKEMIESLRTIDYETIEIRDKWGNEICTCPTNSEGWKQYQNRKVIEWFPHGAPNKYASFTVYIDRGDKQ